MTISDLKNSSLVTDSGCWEWQRGKYRTGYGAIRNPMDGRQTGAHRMAWILTHGPIPEGLHVCHHCDNPPCCNPEHLFVGTAKDNISDCARKGRMDVPYEKRAGELNPNHILTAVDVIEIRRRYEAGGVFQCDLAREYGVTQTAISRIVCRKTWALV